jgi:hypothetical protein
MPAWPAAGTLPAVTGLGHEPDRRRRGGSWPAGGQGGQPGAPVDAIQTDAAMNPGHLRQGVANSTTVTLTRT